MAGFEHGGVLLDRQDKAGLARGSYREMTLSQCQGACEAHPTCVALVRAHQGYAGADVGRCWLRSAVHSSKCHDDPGYDTFVNAAANLSLPVVVLQCRRFDGAGCSLTFVNETQQDFSWHHTETSGVGSLAAEGSRATRTLTAFAALSASRHGPVSGKIVAAAVAKGRPQILQEHLSWWAKYWPQSFVSLGGGDAATRVEQHYWVSASVLIPLLLRGLSR